MQRLSDSRDGGADISVALDGSEEELGQVADGQDADTSGVRISRRTFLRGTGVAAAGLALGGGAPLWLLTQRAAAHGTLEEYAGVWGQRTVYEPTGTLESFDYRPSFHDRMNSWLEFWFNNTPTNYVKPMRLWTYGVHTDHRVSEAHNNGRGFDLSRIYATGFDGDLHRRFYGRYDLWKDWDADNLREVRKHYWATAASAHHHFRDVLTYLHDAIHHNHIHMDNLVSGDGNSTFYTGSEAQTEHVQACCRYIWGKSTRIDGIWGPETRGDSTEVLRRIGREEGTIATSQANWLAFNRASLRKGYGTEEY